MALIFRQNGKLTEITEFERKPPIRFRDESVDRKSRLVYTRRRKDNIIRTRKTCLRRVSAAIEAFGNPLMVTLTFSGDASDASFANDALRRFQVRLRVKYPEARSVFIPELSPRGRIHFHGLLFNVPMSLGDTRVDRRRRIPDGEERTTRTLGKLWGEGYVDALKTDGSGRLVSYVSKYITKHGGEVLFAAMRILRVSGKFPKDKIVRGKAAKRLVKMYEDKEVYSTWEDKSDFLGKIKKTTYWNP
ncbi:hypothetical protein BH11PAT2_BH11PAT2_05430 [soil metagenome]